jgi:hypothetical protein
MYGQFGEDSRIMAKTMRMRVRSVLLPAALVLALFGLVRVATGDSSEPAGNISPVDKWAWSTNAGWINFAPTCTGCQGVSVYADHLEGYS